MNPPRYLSQHNIMALKVRIFLPFNIIKENLKGIMENIVRMDKEMEEEEECCPFFFFSYIREEPYI